MIGWKGELAIVAFFWGLSTVFPVSGPVAQGVLPSEKPASVRIKAAQPPISQGMVPSQNLSSRREVLSGLDLESVPTKTLPYELQKYNTAPLAKLWNVK